MTKKITFACVLPNGVHARPASHIESVCREFKSTIEWLNLRTNIKADAKSVLSLISTNTLQHDECHLIIEGDDEEAAFIKLEKFIKDEFPYCDEAIASAVENEITPLPRSLSNLNPQFVRAKTACNGVGSGILKLINSFDLDKIKSFTKTGSTEQEKFLVSNALSSIKALMIEQISHSSDITKDILTAHLAILEDPSFYEQIELHINENLTAGDAIVNTAHFFSEQLLNSGSDYLKERVLDIRDVCFQLLRQIYGEALFPKTQQLTEPTICLAKDLTPSQFLELDKKYLNGLLLEQSGTTSHTIILAKSLNIPTLVGVDIKQLEHHLNTTVQIDGELGIIVYDLTPEVIRYYKFESALTLQLTEKTHSLIQGEAPLISTQTITINPDWLSKEEVIKGMTDKLLIAERCLYPKKLADDVWQREDVFSTALGFGFAIPHTKSEHIEQSTISVTKLQKPVLWGEEEVNFIIMLTLNKHAAGDQHMRIFSKLARRIMHEEFRASLMNSTTATEIEAILRKELEI